MEFKLQNVDKAFHSKAANIISVNPSNGQELGRVPSVGKIGIDNAVAAARRAFADWQRIPINERERYLRNLLRMILESREKIARLIAMEQGKPIVEALMAEIIPTLANVRYLSRHAHRVLRSRPVDHELLLFAHKKSRYELVPYGVVAIISPWNFPFSVPLPQIAAAIVAGNTVVFKPAPQAVLVGEMIMELCRKANLPDGVVQWTPVEDVDAPYLTEHPGIDKIIFTGSTETGKKVMSAAAKGVKAVVLELGGKDAAIVAADADIARAAKGVVWGSLFCAGQVCASIERVYVEEAVAEPFIKACLSEIQKVRVGDPLEENVDMGPLTTEEQLEIVLSHLRDAVDKGAKILYGGERLKERGFFLQPTLLTNVDHTMKIMTEETFGPVVAIMTVKDIDEAIRLANDTIYGLSAYGWTSSRRTAKKLMRELVAGTVMINDATSSWGEPKAPWVGFKQSGIGLSRSDYGLMEMVRVKYVSYDRGNNETNCWWFPYTSGAKKFADDAMEFLFQRSLWRKFKSLIPMLKYRPFLQSTHWLATLRKIYKAF